MYFSVQDLFKPSSSAHFSIAFLCLSNSSGDSSNFCVLNISQADELSSRDSQDGRQPKKHPAAQMEQIPYLLCNARPSFLKKLLLSFRGRQSVNASTAYGLPRFRYISLWRRHFSKINIHFIVIDYFNFLNI